MQLTRYEQALVAWVQAYYAHHELRVNCATLIQVRVCATVCICLWVCVWNEPIDSSL
jgi:hypothetical protein